MIVTAMNTPGNPYEFADAMCIMHACLILAVGFWQLSFGLFAHGHHLF
jgi:hypothetical protein